MTKIPISQSSVDQDMAVIETAMLQLVELIARQVVHEVARSEIAEMEKDNDAGSTPRSPAMVPPFE